MHSIDGNKLMDPAEHTVQKQRAFSLVAPLLYAALLIGAGGGFLLATVLTLTSAFSLPLGSWWTAMAQAHGHLQLYGWAGLFVLGVALHFLPRLRGTPLVAARCVPVMLVMLVISMLLRAVCQPFLAGSVALGWRLGLISSGLLELAAIVLVLVMLIGTAMRGPSMSSRQAYRGIFPMLLGAFSAFAIAGLINLLNMVQVGSGVGLVPAPGDTLNITLGLFGFLVPIALAMSARSLPMYAGLESFPSRILWLLAVCYFAGLLLFCLGISSVLSPVLNTVLSGVGLVLLGGCILLFIIIFLRLMRSRGKVPQHIARYAPSPENMTRTYQQQVKTEHTNYGPFVVLVASSYMWAMLGSVLLLINGVAELVTGNFPFALDAIRHSFAIGFIALLISGIAPRMLPSFSGGKIASPHLVTATLWLGNIAAVLRVGAILLAPLLASGGIYALSTMIFGLSGPFGLVFVLCLAINLWPALHSQK